MSKKSGKVKNGTKPAVESSDMYMIQSDRPVPPNRREISGKLSETMGLMKSGDSFNMPGTSWYALKSKLGKNPGVYTYRKNKETDVLTVWKR